MGKVNQNNDFNERLKRRRRRKELEQLRQNALAAKRNLRNLPGKQAVKNNGKTKLMKTLNEFAEKRNELETVNGTYVPLLNRTKLAIEQKSQELTENISQTQNPSKNKVRIVKEQVLEKPLVKRGLFFAGVKGKEFHRSSILNKQQEKIKQAILKGDALALMQSDVNIKYEEMKNKEIDDDFKPDPLMEMEIKKVIHGFTSSDSDDSNSLSDSNLNKFNPISNKEKGAKNKANQEKLNDDSKHIPKEDKYKRQTFTENNKIAKHLHSLCKDADLFRRSTPENVIYYSQRVPPENVTNVNKKENYKINLMDEQLIKGYTKICNKIAKVDFNNTFWNALEDPLIKAQMSLKATLKTTFKNYLHQPKFKSTDKSDLTNHTATSNNSESIMHPDSDIARTLKRNNQTLKQSKTTSVARSSSDSLTNKLSDTIHIDHSVQFNHVKRKRVPSSKSENSTKIHSSPNVNVNLENIFLESTINNIHPDRQELFARYLNDVSTDNEIKETLKAIKCNSILKNRMVMHDSHSIMSTMHKNAKHIPSILRKNRILKSDEIINKMFIPNFNFDNVKSERTPNSMVNQTIEAPKCKYVHMNAKYNQPSRINISMVQTKRCQNPVMPDRHLFLSPNHMESEFILTQKFNSNSSPSEKQYTELENVMMPMPSFGEINDKTNRLTLHSSLGCSQGNQNNLPCTEEHYNSHQSMFHQQFEPHNYTAKCNVEQLQKGSCFSRVNNCNCINECPNIIIHDTEQYLTKPTVNFSTQQQIIQQPVKYFAVEGPSGSQKHPIYSEDDNCAYKHKPLKNSQSQETCYLLDHHSLNQHHNIVKSITHNEYKILPKPYEAIPLYSNISTNYKIEDSRKKINPVNFVSNDSNSKIFTNQQIIRTHAPINEHRHIRHKKQLQSTMYSQVERENNFHNNNKKLF